MENPFLKCCAEEINRLWSVSGSMDIVWYEGECPECKHYIGITQTSEKQAIEFLKPFNIDYTWKTSQ